VAARPRDRRVNPHPGQTLTLDELRDFGAERLSSYKLPRELIVRDIPRNPSGKILKHVLRAELARLPVRQTER
jgi:fatty-acyl-CoA synthase